MDLERSLRAIEADKDARFLNLREIVLGHITNGIVLDVGSGTGHVSLVVAQTAREVLSIDISISLLQCMMKSRSIGIGNVHTIIMDATYLGVKSGGVDCVLCLDLLEHLAHDVTCVREAFRVLKPGGRVVVVVPAIRKLFGHRDTRIGHFRRYDRPDLESIVCAGGFKVRSVRYWNLIGFFFYFFFEKILRRAISEEIRYSPHGAGTFLNKVLSTVLRLEKYVTFPIGLSLVLVAEK